MLQAANEAANQVYWQVEIRITDFIYNPIIKDLRDAGISRLLVDKKYVHPPLFTHVYEMDTRNNILLTIRHLVKENLKNI